MRITTALTVSAFALALLPASAIIALQSLPPTTAWPLLVLAAINHAALLLALSHPNRALGIVAVSMAAQALLTGLFFLLPSTLILLPVLFLTTAHGSRILALAVAALGSTAIAVRYSFDPSAVAEPIGPAPWMVFVLVLAVSGAAMALGLAHRARLHAEQLSASSLELERATLAAERHEREAERREHKARTNAQEAERTAAIAEERARISRELHDVLAHSFTVIVSQSRVARFDTGQSESALTVIEDTARASLAEIRGTLHILRGQGGVSGQGNGGTTSARASTKGLHEVTDLLDRSGELGLVVARMIIGDPVPVADDVRTVLFRFVQEALTNAARHAPGTTVRYREAWDGGTIVVSVSNPAPAVGGVEGTGGQGLIGMRERLESVGGSFDVRSGANFTVTATVPVPVPAQAQVLR